MIIKMHDLKRNLKDFTKRCLAAFLSMRLRPSVFLLVAALGLVFCAVFPHAAMAWNAEQAVRSILDFFKLLIIVGAAAVAVLMVFRSQVIPAVVVVIAAAFLYVVLTPEIMQSIGEGIKELLKLSGGASGTG